MQLENLLWQDRNEINVGDLWKLLCTYCYLPRLSSFEVLQNTIQSGVNSEDYFAYAESVNDGKYVALKYNQYVGYIDRSGYIVKKDAALKQKAAETTISTPKPPVFGGNDHPGNLLGGQGGTEQPVSGSGDNPPEKPSKIQNRHFEMMTTLDSTRVVKNIGNLMDEVINHLMQVDGANVEIKLLVEATMLDGTPVTTVRTVTENCKTLKVESFGFDE